MKRLLKRQAGLSAGNDGSYHQPFSWNRRTGDRSEIDRKFRISVGTGRWDWNVQRTKEMYKASNSRPNTNYPQRYPWSSNSEALRRWKIVACFILLIFLLLGILVAEVSPNATLVLPSHFHTQSISSQDDYAFDMYWKNYDTHASKGMRLKRSVLDSANMKKSRRVLGLCALYPFNVLADFQLTWISLSTPTVLYASTNSMS